MPWSETQIYTAGDPISIIVVGAILAGLLLASKLLLKPPKGASSGLGEDTPPSVSTKGTWIPVYFGKRKTKTTVIGWTGNRTSAQENVGGGGGKGGGGGGQQKQTVYYEETWHILSVGNPMSRLDEIRIGGKTVWTGPISASTSPSGTEVAVSGHGSFVIYWGESDQPVNEWLGDATRVGIRSRWPRLTYVYWKPLRYGTSPTQPQVEYIGSWGCQRGSLQDSSYVLDDGTSQGINGAHLIHALMTGEKFIGANLELDAIDNASLESLGELLEDEHVPCNMAILDGPEAARPLQALLQDMGVMMPQAGGRLMFLPQRYSAADVPILTDDEIIPPDIDVEQDLSEGRVSRPVFIFKDETGNNFRDQDAPSFTDSGEEETLGLATSQRVPLETVTHIDAASKVARRRSQEVTLNSNIKVRAVRGARLLLPGQVFIREGFGRLRVSGIQWNDETPETQITCALDTYGLPDTDDMLTIGAPGGGLLAPEEDIAFDWFEIPPELQSGASIEIAVVRSRAHSQIFTAGIHLSVDGTSFTRVGDQTHSQGGLLEEALDDSVEDLIPVGPKFEPDNEDIINILDLSSNVSEWQSGRQVAMIKNASDAKEVFFVQSFEPVDEADWSASAPISAGDFVRPTGASPNLRFKAGGAGTTGAVEPTWPEEVGDTVNDNGITWTAHRFAYTPINMIRARYGTYAESHAIGDRIFIADSSQLIPFTLQSFVSGQDVCVKTTPRTSGGEVDIGTVSAVCDTLQGDPSDTTEYRSTDIGPRTTATGDRRISDTSI